MVMFMKENLKMENQMERRGRNEYRTAQAEGPPDHGGADRAGCFRRHEIFDVLETGK